MSTCYRPCDAPLRTGRCIWCIFIIDSARRGGGWESAVDKNKGSVSGESVLFCFLFFFNCRACHHTLILDLCSICRRVSYICRLSRCYCSSAAMESEAMISVAKGGDTSVYFWAKSVCFSRDFSLPTRGIGRRDSGKHPSFVAVEKCSTLAYFCSEFFTRFWSRLLSHGTCIPLLHHNKAWFIFSLPCAYLIMLFSLIHGSIPAPR